MVIYSFAARYPFTADAKRIVNGNGYTFDRLLNDGDCEDVRVHALARVGAAINNGELPQPAKEMTELLSYPLSRMIVAAMHDDRLNNRLVVWESKRLGKLLAADSKEAVAMVSEELLKGQGWRRPDGYCMHFTDYAAFAPKFRDNKWKLINMPMEKGIVYVNLEDYKRLLEEAYKERELANLRRLMGQMNDEGDLPDDIKALIARLEPALEQYRKDVRIEVTPQAWAFPPCMRDIMSKLNKGENLPHTARFAMTAFLSNIGHDSESVLKLFGTSPDFNPDKARYQVEHICRMGYTAPMCKTMKTNGNCNGTDGLCEWVDHPLVYYRRKVRRALSENRNEENDVK